MLRPALIALAAAVLLLPATSASAQGGDFEWQVVGGHDAGIEEYPWQAAVFADGSFCGGVLITRRIVLTAAHCVTDGFPFTVDPNDVSVVLGQTNPFEAGSGEVKAVQEVDFQSLNDPYPGGEQAPQYDPVTNENDVGYLVLDSAVTLGQTIQTIDIAAESEAAVWAPNPEVFNEISGWGSTAEGGSLSDVLQAASVPIVSDETCASPSYYGAFFHEESMVCAGFPDGEVDTCQGDSGGPLQAPLEGEDYRLIGLTSWGEGCARPNKPGVYARVADDPLRTAIVARVDDFETTLGIPLEEQEDVVSSGGGTPKTGPPKYPPSSSEPPPSQPPPSSSVPQQPPATSSTTTTQAKKKSPFAKCRKITKRAKRKSPSKMKKAKQQRKRCMRKVKKRLRRAR